MLRDGAHMIAAHPLTGVGPNMVERRVRASTAGRDAVEQINPHLHNVPLQIAAERGLPALAVWLWFIVALVRDLLARVLGAAGSAFLAAAGARRGRRDARRRAVRVQLRRLRSS